MQLTQYTMCTLMYMKIEEYETQIKRALNENSTNHLATYNSVTLN